MTIPTPAELIRLHGKHRPEHLADALGFHVRRADLMPLLPGVTVVSEYIPGGDILLYRPALRKLAEQRREPLAGLEQWHIAHELYHALADAQSAPAWRVRETEADVWADELVALVGVG